MYSKEASPSHRNPGIHRTCILRSLKGGPWDTGHDAAITTCRQDCRPRLSRQHNCNSAILAEHVYMSAKTCSFLVVVESARFLRWSNAAPQRRRNRPTVPRPKGTADQVPPSRCCADISTRRSSHRLLSTKNPYNRIHAMLDSVQGRQ